MSLISNLLQEIAHTASVILDRKTPLKDSVKAYIDALLPKKSNANLVVMLEGFEEAYLGTAERIDLGVVAVYDQKKCIRVIMQQESVSQAAARELFEYNIGNTWLGEKGPLFITIEGE